MKDGSSSVSMLKTKQNKTKKTLRNGKCVVSTNPCNCSELFLAFHLVCISQSDHVGDAGKIMTRLFFSVYFWKEKLSGLDL